MTSPSLPLLYAEAAKVSEDEAAGRKVRVRASNRRRRLAAETSLGREPEEMPVNNPGYDIRSATPDGSLIHVEVKGRLSGATDFFVTYNEVLLGKNSAPNYRLALVDVSPDGREHDEIRYLSDPLARVTISDFTATGITGKWSAEWARGNAPF